MEYNNDIYELKKKYKELLIKNHPDKNPSQSCESITNIKKEYNNIINSLADIDITYKISALELLQDSFKINITRYKKCCCKKKCPEFLLLDSIDFKKCQHLVNYVFPQRGNILCSNDIGNLNIKFLPSDYFIKQKDINVILDITLYEYLNGFEKKIKFYNFGWINLNFSVLDLIKEKQFTTIIADHIINVLFNIINKEKIVEEIKKNDIFLKKIFNK